MISRCTGELYYCVLLPQGLLIADVDGEVGTANDARVLQVMDVEGHIDFEE